MKTIGLLGGMSWESTADYYRLINVLIQKRLGGLHSAKLILNSVDFVEIEQLQQQGNWHKAGELLSEAAQSIEKAGADCVVLCTNTMHIVSEDIKQYISIPFLHIAEATAQKLVSNNIKTVGLLGTAFTMEKTFYKGLLTENYGLNVITPNTEDRNIIHQVIFHELCLGRLETSSKQKFLKIIQDLANQGAEAIILGCTEIGMLIKQQDTDIKLFDTTLIHAEHAVNWALTD